MRRSLFCFLLVGTAYALTVGVLARDFNIPSGDLKSALESYMKQSGVALMYPEDEVSGVHTKGVSGAFSSEDALARLLRGTGLSTQRAPSGAIGIVPDDSAHDKSTLEASPIRLAAATTQTLETVTVTSSKIGGDVQNVPIAITAMSQEQLTQTQTAGGPDLVKQVPNLTFTKTNFTGYSIQIRGIGTQAVSVTTDPAVAVALNDIPFIRNHFFEQEFYDVSNLEVVRGPQGTLYGRNATAGVVNMVSAKPSDQFEAMASADIGNYQNRRLEGMINVPVVDDRLDFRIAGEWTKRSGYTFNETTDQSVDGRDLWSSRVSIGMKPVEQLQAYLIWEHFSEDDDRVRSAKQLCEKDPGPTSVDGLDLTTYPFTVNADNPPGFISAMVRAWLSQGCLPTSFYSKNAYETPNGQAIPFIAVDEYFYKILNPVDPYASQTQSPNLRVIQSKINPSYRAKNDTLEFNADYALTTALTLTSQTGYNNDFLYSTEDFNRFDTASGLFSGLNEGIDGPGSPSPALNGVYCDPQLGCSSAIVGEDLSQEHAWQFSQEVRLASNFSGPFNFNVGANYLHYQTVEDYYTFFNLISATEQDLNISGPGQYDSCGIRNYNFNTGVTTYVPFPIYPVPAIFNLGPVFNKPVPPGEVTSALSCAHAEVGSYIDPNPIDHLNGLGHNYFRSENPYRLNSVAGFGEAYYQVTPDVKLTGGLRWTDDSKFFIDIPSQVFLLGGGYPVSGTVSQEWKEWTGRFVADWAPKLDFTDATLLYASYSRGYKGGGANPPGPYIDIFSPGTSVTHPLTFAPEFVNAYELGTKNTLLDGGLTLNGDVFYYDYKGYQISQIVDRTSVNLNINAKVKGAELEATWEPLPGLRFNFAGGLEDTSIDNGQSAIDLIDRTAGNPNWMVVKPYISDTSNCILPTNLVRQIILNYPYALMDACDGTYRPGLDLTGPGSTVPADVAAVGFDPSTAPNGGEGFSKNLSGNKLPNAPPFTLSFGSQYTMPVTTDWAGTLRGDFYWQGNSFARIFNDVPYDQLHGYTNVNLSLIFTNQNGWQAMAYVKNVFDTTAITGAFLNTDDTGLTTNVFVTDPRLFGIRLTKNW